MKKVLLIVVTVVVVLSVSIMPVFAATYKDYNLNMCDYGTFTNYSIYDMWDREAYPYVFVYDYSTDSSINIVAIFSDQPCLKLWYFTKDGQTQITPRAYGTCNLLVCSVINQTQSYIDTYGCLRWSMSEQSFENSTGTSFMSTINSKDRFYSNYDVYSYNDSILFSPASAELPKLIPENPTIDTMFSEDGEVGSIVESSTHWVDALAKAITDTPFILAFVLVAFVGLSIRIICRLRK